MRTQSNTFEVKKCKCNDFDFTILRQLKCDM